MDLSSEDDTEVGRLVGGGVTTKQSITLISDPEGTTTRWSTYAGIAVVPTLFGAFSSKLAIERVLQGSFWPFVK